MDKALESILVYPYNQDYIEISYRYDFLKTFENNIHEVCRLPFDDVLYIKHTNEDTVCNFNRIVTEVYPENRERFMTSYRYFNHIVEMGLAI